MHGGPVRGLKSCSRFARSFSRPHLRHRSTAATLIGEDLGPTKQEGHQTFRVRKDGTKLPLPPVLDPIVREERGRWEQTKAKPDVAKFTPFQKKLWDNPYAHALASPVRQCRATGVLLPSDLLVTLHPRLNPETSDPWLLPVSLTTSSKRLGVSYRFLGRKIVAQQLSKKKQWKSGMYQRFHDKFGAKLTRMVWREDMAELVLSLLRKKLVGKLKWYFQNQGRLVSVDSPRTEDIDGVESVSCVLYLGSLKTNADELQSQAERIMHTTESLAQNFAAEIESRLDSHPSKAASHPAPQWWRGPLVPHLRRRVMFPPLDFKITEWRGSKVPVYSLLDLLGEKGLSELIKDSKFEGERCLAMKRGRHNVPVELLLMQLQSYLARPGP